jgi:adenosylcobinamide kinase/adenosylcobinamide-phosphate guanylyltransferase
LTGLKKDLAPARPPGRLPGLTLVIGGASSGKSSLAEGLVRGSGLAPVYLATARAWDDEMRAKIAAHRAARASDGWRTVEEPADLSVPLGRVAAGEAVLLDCATMWLTNVMLDGGDPAAATGALMAALAACAGPVVVVTNEVGMGIVPDNALARRFRDEQGRLNAALGSAAGLVVGVMAGLPFVLKGQLPQ